VSAEGVVDWTLEGGSFVIRKSSYVMFGFLVYIFAALLNPVSAQQAGGARYQDRPILPAGIVGERITKLIETFNSGDPARVKSFLEEECTASFRNFVPLEEHLSVFVSTRRQWGEVAFHGIRSYDPPRPDETVVILKDSNFDAWRAFTLRFDEGQGYKVAGIGLNDARTPTSVSEPAFVEQDLVREVAALLDRACERDVFSGSVLVAKGEEVLFSHACGEASKRFHVSNNIDTKFNLGSMNKMFTSTAVMQLVENGTISVTDTLSKFLDESWLPREVTDRITIHHLLTHTSGLGSYFNQEYWNSSRELYRALDDYKPLIRDERPAFEPGTNWQYSNTGMFLLGVVIESATGDDYFDYIREHIYGRAGMENSDCYDMDLPVENLAIGYDPAPSSEWGYENNLYKHVIRGGPAGGGFSTVGDLHRYALALLAGDLVSEESRETMWTDHFGAGYGYGFGIQEGPNGKVVGHSGGFSGINSNLDIMLDRGYIVAVMSNFGDAASPIASRIAALISRVPGEQ
jgi:CubicO group peptidase (beta-lactamase class C family)